MKNTPTRTNFSLLVELSKELGGEPMKQAFLRDMADYVKANMVDKELTEEEFQSCLKKMREELPAFKEYLLQNRL